MSSRLKLAAAAAEPIRSRREATFSADLSARGRPLPHVWEHTVGSGHAALALRADWQEQLARCRRELGFRHVRFHGLLCDDVGTLVRQNGRLTDSFFNAGRIWDFLLSIGMRPFVELSFMPGALASGRKTVFHYGANVTPARKHGEWSGLIERLVGFAVERYGREEVRRWPFEVWNEPNLKAFGTGSRAGYFRLYATTARAVKAVDPDIPVGGPATAQNAWIEEFLAFCGDRGLPADFVSTHHYPNDDASGSGGGVEEQLARVHRNTLQEHERRVRTQVGKRPLYYTEWNAATDDRLPLHDEPYSAAFAVKASLDAADTVDAYSWWTFSDIFEENYFPSVPFHGGFGLLTLHGIAKPVYRAFELLHRLGEERLAVSGRHATVDARVIRRGTDATIVLTNWALPRHPIKREEVRVRLASPAPPRTASIERIDTEHGNARRLWREMGEPTYPTPRQVEELHHASEIPREGLPVRTEGEEIAFEVTLPPQSVAAVTLEFS
jgi:xylan 1,4-beta-xylosidase